MFFPPPLKSSAAMRAASTEPMPLVSWKMPEISLSTPTRTTLSEICARAAPHVAHDKASARPNLKTFIVFSPWNLILSFPDFAGFDFTVRYRANTPSQLPVRQVEDQTIEIGGELDLAGQAAVGPPFGGGAIQQRVLIAAHGRETREPALVDIDMAGGAHGVAAAFRQDSADIVARRGLHGAFTGARLDVLPASVGMHEDDAWHKRSVRPEKSEWGDFRGRVARCCSSASP